MSINSARAIGVLALRLRMLKGLLSPPPLKIRSFFTVPNKGLQCYSVSVSEKGLVVVFCKQLSQCHKRPSRFILTVMQLSWRVEWNNGRIKLFWICWICYWNGSNNCMIFWKQKKCPVLHNLVSTTMDYWTTWESHWLLNSSNVLN